MHGNRRRKAFGTPFWAIQNHEQVMKTSLVCVAIPKIAQSCPRDRILTVLSSSAKGETICCKQVGQDDKIKGMHKSLLQVSASVILQLEGTSSSGKSQIQELVRVEINPKSIMCNYRSTYGEPSKRHKLSYHLPNKKLFAERISVVLRWLYRRPFSCTSKAPGTIPKRFSGHCFPQYQNCPNWFSCRQDKFRSKTVKAIDWVYFLAFSKQEDGEKGATYRPLRLWGMYNLCMPVGIYICTYKSRWSIGSRCLFWVPKLTSCLAWSHEICRW